MMSELRGYGTGGTVHFVINNQIGFTTTPDFGRSSPYCSDVAKMIQAPIFHVNGDDPEAVVHVTRIATEFRQRFSCDVVIDMFCYRRHGHNEGDEPSFTQPLMYRRIAQHPTTRQIYARKLVEEGVLIEEEADRQVEGVLDLDLGAVRAAVFGLFDLDRRAAGVVNLEGHGGVEGEDVLAGLAHLERNKARPGPGERDVDAGVLHRGVGEGRGARGGGRGDGHG